MNRIQPGEDTQNSRILAKLLENPGEFFAMPLLAEVGSGKRFGFCMVHSRIADLRKDGRTIEQKEYREGKSVHSFYRLIPQFELTP